MTFFTNLRRSTLRLAGTLAAASGLALGLAAPAQAYPSSLVFAPVGGVMPAWEGQMYTYNGFYQGGLNYWQGFQMGLWDGLQPWGEDGPSVGAVEAGVDIIAGIAIPMYKPIANVKVGLISEGEMWPSVSVGFSNFAFMAPNDSLNAAYVVGSKELKLGNFVLGSATLGALRAFSGPGAGAAFTASAPLPAPYGLLAGFALPPMGPFGLAIDHVGGTSELSSTNLVLNVALLPNTFTSIGYAIGHDRSAQDTDAIFTQVGFNFSGTEFAKLARPVMPW